MHGETVKIIYSTSFAETFAYNNNKFVFSIFIHIFTLVLPVALIFSVITPFNLSLLSGKLLLTIR